MILIIDISLLAAPLAAAVDQGAGAGATTTCRRIGAVLGRCLLLSLLFGGDEVVYLYVALLYGLLLKPLLIRLLLALLILALRLLLALLLVGVLVVHSVVEVLIVQFFIVAVQLTDARMESYHNVFVLHESFGHLENFDSSFFACLCVKRAQDHGARGVVFH